MREMTEDELKTHRKNVENYNKVHTEVTIPRPDGKPWTFSVHNDMLNLVNTMNNYPGVHVIHSYSGEADSDSTYTLDNFP